MLSCFANSLRWASPSLVRFETPPPAFNVLLSNISLVLGCPMRFLHLSSCAAVMADTPAPVGLPKVYAVGRSNPLPPVESYTLPIENTQAPEVPVTPAPRAEPLSIVQAITKAASDGIKDAAVTLNETTIPKRTDKHAPTVAGADDRTDEVPSTATSGDAPVKPTGASGCKKKPKVFRCPGPDCGPSDDASTNMEKRNAESETGSGADANEDDCWEDVPEDICTPAPLDATVDAMRSYGVWGLYARVRNYADCVVCTDLVGQLPEGFFGNDCVAYTKNANQAKIKMDLARKNANATESQNDHAAKAWSSAREQARACSALLPKFTANRATMLSTYSSLDMEHYANAENKATVFCKQMKCCNEAE